MLETCRGSDDAEGLPGSMMMMGELEEMVVLSTYKGQKRKRAPQSARNRFGKRSRLVIVTETNVTVKMPERLSLLGPTPLTRRHKGSVISLFFCFCFYNSQMGDALIRLVLKS